MSLKAGAPATVFIAVMLSLFLTVAMADGLDGGPPKAGEGEGTAVDTTKAPTAPPYYAWTKTQVDLTWGIVVFALALFAGQFAVMFVSKQFWTDRQFKAFTLTLILTVGLILIIAGFTDAQIAPMMGLIGTIAGYVLGSSGKDQVDKLKVPEPQVNEAPAPPQ